jgi:hypothetical protein
MIQFTIRDKILSLLSQREVRRLSDNSLSLEGEGRGEGERN